MTNRKTTKNALIFSALSLLLCFSMLIGTTFAWFTDSVTSSGNIIQSGTLDIAMSWADGTTDPAQTTWKNAEEGAIFNYDKWEPGFAEVRHIKIENKGTLALKYTVVIEPTGTVDDLADVIDVYFVDPAVQVTGRDKLTDANKIGTLTEVLGKMTELSSATMLAGETDTVTIALKMQETAGNEYQGKQIGDSFAIKLLATQLTSEKDSFDDQYDKATPWLGQADISWYDATKTEFTLSSAEELAGLAAIVNGTAKSDISKLSTDTTETTVQDDFAGKTIKLSSDIDLNGLAWTPIGRFVDGKTTTFTYAFRGTFDGQGYTVSNLKVTSEGWAGLFGVAYKANINNVTVDGVKLNGSRMTGAVVGQIYGSIDNCHVKNAEIIVVPNKVASGYDNGDKVGGIVGWIGDNGENNTLKNCSADKVTVKGYRDIGGIAGYVAWSTTLENNKVTNSTITGDQSVNFYGKKDYNVGAVWGRNSVSSSGVGINDVNNSSENVTVKTVNVIADEASLKAAMAAGGEYALAADITLTEKLTVGAGIDTVIYLNGKALSYENTTTATHNFMIDVKGGTLTLYNGTVSMTHTGTNMAWNGATTVIDVTAGGVLNLEGVTVENKGGTDMNFAVHLNNWGEATLNANNCVFDATYCGVRVFNSGYDMNNVKITNSTLTGSTRAFWVHNYFGDLNSAQHSDDAIKARLNLDIYGNNNKFEITGTAKSPIRYGFGTTVYYDTDGNLIP